MASMERGMGSMRAAPEELRTEAEVRVRTVPKVNGWESAAHMKWLALREKEVEEVDEINDCFGVEASEFRDTWNRRYSSYCGFFEDTTKVLNKRFTYKKPHDCASPQTTLQVFSLKIAKLRVGLQWPLQVFGMVAIRDCIDQNRNIIFDRPRHHCQIVTRECKAVCSCKRTASRYIIL